MTHCHRRLHEVFGEREWAGRPAFVAGGGPSLSHFDWDRLQGRRWIGCNRAFWHSPTIAIVGDRPYQEEVGFSRRWRDAQFHRVFYRAESYVTPPRGFDERVIELPASGEEVWPCSLRDAWPPGCTGVLALALADVLGADPIYLLGFDLHDIGSEARNWHHAYPWDRGPDSVYRTFRAQFERFAPDIKARVVNLNPASALTCFPFAWEVE